MLKNTFKYFIINKYNYKIFNLFKSKLIKVFLKKGNKFKSIKFLYDLKYILKKTSKKDANLILLIFLLKAILKLYFIKIRLGGKYKEIPIPLLNERQIRFVV